MTHPVLFLFFSLFQPSEYVSECDIVKVLCAQSLWLLVLDSSVYTDAEGNKSERASSLAWNVPRNVPLLYRHYNYDIEVNREDLGSSNSTELFGVEIAPGMYNYS